MVFLAKAWALLKSYWYVPVILMVTLGAYLMGKKDLVDWAQVLDNARSNHRKQVAAIEKAKEEELKKREAALRRMEEARKKIEEEYRREDKEIDAKKQKEVERILKKTKNDPVAMAEELKKSTGYTVIVLD